VFIFLTPGSPSAGSRGSVVDHIGFGVLNPEDSIAKWSAAGVKVGRIGKSPLNGNTVGNVYSPDDIEIEITQENGVDPYPLLPPNTSIESNHMHIYVPVAIRKEMRDWYANMFGAIPGELGANLTGELPGAKFVRWTAHAEATMPTKGRALDHRLQGERPAILLQKTGNKRRQIRATLQQVPSQELRQRRICGSLGRVDRVDRRSEPFLKGLCAVGGPRVKPELS